MPILAIVLCAVFLALSSPSLAAQETVRISGMVTDFTSGSSLPDVEIIVYRDSLDGVGSRMLSTRGHTDGRGHFQLAAPGLAWLTLIFRRAGYAPDSMSLFSGNGISGAFRSLVRSAIELEPIDVSTTPVGREQVRSVGEFTRSAQELRTVPPAGGIEDPVRALAAEPGIRLASPWSSRIVVRGSGPSDNGLFLLGFPLYNAVHAGGALSGFPSTAVTDAHFWATGAPARYGGFGGSVLDFDVLPDSFSGTTGEAILNLLNGEAQVSHASLAGTRARLAVRRSWLAPVWENFTSSTAFGLADYLLAIEVPISSRLHVDGIGFSGSDTVGDSTDFGPGLSRAVYRRESTLVGARGVWRPSTGRSVTLKAWSSHASAEGVQLDLGALRARDTSFIHESGALLMARAEAVGHEWEAGILARDQSGGSAASYSTFLHDLPAGSVTNEGVRRELRAFAGASMSLGHDRSMGASLSIVTGGQLSLLEPSIRADIPLGPSVRAQLSIARKHQTIFLGTDPRSRPWDHLNIVDLWLVAGSSVGGVRIRPARTDELAGALSFSLASGPTFRVEGYFKRLADQPEYFPDTLQAGGLPLLRTVPGRAAGMTIGARFDLPASWQLSAHYTWARAWRSSGPGAFVSDFDVPHRLSAQLSRTVAQGWVLSANSTLESGSPYTSAAYTYTFDNYDPYQGFLPSDIAGGAELLFGRRNATRLPFTHRLDLKLGYRESSSTVDWEVFAAVANLTGGQSIPPDYRVIGGGAVVLHRQNAYSLAPIPLVGFRVEF